MSLSRIEWTDRTWNPVRGCTRVSEGCRFCYAERLSARGLPGHNSPTTGEPFARMTKGGPRWTGEVEFLPHKLAEPLGWRKPARVFVNSMSDLFHEDLADEEIAAVFGVMAACPQHTFQVLTKRPERAVEWFQWLNQVGSTSTNAERCGAFAFTRTSAAPRIGAYAETPWPLPNVWLGVSAEDQEAADVRIPLLLQCPAAVRFVSYEPALGPARFARWMPQCAMQNGEALRIEGGCGDCDRCLYTHRLPSTLDWIIAGGESGPGARPPQVEWFRSVRGQCAAAGVPFLFKQWGKWAPYEHLPESTKRHLDAAGTQLYTDPVGPEPFGVGKKRAGRELDGETWDQFPEVSP